MKKMKQKLLTATVAGALTLSLAAGAGAEQKEQVNIYDQQKNLVKSVVFVPGQKEYFVNGQTPGVKMDAAPYISQNRTFVPVRYLGNALGVVNENIAWDTKTSKAKLTLGSRSAELTIGKKQIISNGKVVEADVAPELKSGRTFLPARFVAEALGYRVDFIDGLVVCYPEGSQKPDISAVKQYINQQQPPVQQGETKNLNGYTVPVKPKTDLIIKYGEEEKTNKVEMNIAIIIPNRDVQAQCDEAEQILASKFGKDFAKKVVDVARTKTDVWQEISTGKFPTFTGPNGELVDVNSGWGSTRTSIVVWSKGGSN
ncbi:copper amine oxidase N-terminal domain-containing protein [Desulforamulus hydrothermalis]|uniref:Copper amine oxidase-like domain-containing protein n=1 Tax=Desulforamulus hydrothermalis Lam5 = DSM 18033 TaxID=1121428 RepID=K8E056_9FIRM|nr:copper amine oxidase N-terminal domain-containing protein [Desulforamulus hydrothermalis]CCO08857.1 Copper amine oxidase-like domain-containing protein [Desulforamulus hydrothermalis Lam5 = DSM 18033]SHG73355.1 Copper amine oxidase N-terminal domain-containing protein [Desulforamulus hydrothermalis Lam5 = DSM 18033]